MTHTVLTKTGFTEPPAELSPIEAGYPLTLQWPDGSQERYYNHAMLSYAIHPRELVKEAQALGGCASAQAEQER